MNELKMNSGAELLDLMMKMEDRLLDRNFWFREIKAYRKLKAMLTQHLKQTI
jgi:hypothetical protein